MAIIIFQNKNKNRKPTPHNVQADITEISEKKSLPFLSPFGVGMSYVMTSFCFFSTSSFFCQKQRAKLIVKNLKSLTHVQLLWIWFWKRSWSVTMGVPFHILETLPKFILHILHSSMYSSNYCSVTLPWTPFWHFWSQSKSPRLTITIRLRIKMQPSK